MGELIMGIVVGLSVILVVETWIMVKLVIKSTREAEGH